jgi:nuclear transport factor 2 (NTF2) superfamily protein
MKKRITKSSKKRKASKVDLNNSEDSFGRFVREMCNNRETVMGYLNASIKDGMSRQKAMAELHRFGIYLKNLK